ncbi:MAG: hypothetical protein IJ606_06345 [Bacteroidaceae bacterium]|nr:hypothetical protein [Bacteroidaceae bacterium]
MKKMFVAAFVCAAMCTMFTNCTTTRPVSATSNPVGNKCGEATATRILGIFGGSDNIGINAAAKNGGITKISHVDVVSRNYGVYQKITTRVYGE